MCGCLSHSPILGDLARNPGMCSNWESNQRPFGSQAGAQSTQPHQAGHSASFLTTSVEGRVTEFVAIDRLSSMR